VAALEYHIGQRGYPGFTASVTGASGNTFREVVPAFVRVDATGNTAPAGSAADPLYVTGSSGGALPAGTDRSGTATTTAGVLAPANASRTFLVGQNIGANTIWINEIGGTAAASTVGSYKVTSGTSFSINTNRAVSVIAETGNTAFTATEG
jgi:hypothetical protein